MGFIYNQIFVTPPAITQSFTGQTVIITGSNTGLGLEAARTITRLNAAKVILAVRNLTAGEQAKSSIEESTNRKDVVEVWHLDLASYSSVKSFATKAQSLPRLDVLLENAGIATGTYRQAEQDESTITVNVVNTILLALLLLPKLQETATKHKTTPHLTIVSSEVHAWSKFPERDASNIFAALSDPKAPNMSDRYMVSKLLEVLVVRAISDTIAKGKNGDVVLNMLNPGLCHSELSRESGLGLTVMKFFLARTTEVGSRTLVAAACAGRDSHGKYMSNGVVEESEVVAWVKTEQGKKVGDRVWKELQAKLEGIAPGVTKNIE